MPDHRPLLCWLTGPEFIQVEPETQKPRAPPRVVRNHRLKQQDKRTEDKYISKLRELNTADGLSSDVTPAETPKTLLRMSTNGV